VTLRRARPDDVPTLAAMIERANLPAVFIEEFIDGFVVAERGGRVLGCGGVELYGESAFIRSVVVEPEAQGLGLGRRIAEALEADARAAGATELYLFTMDAHEFWRHLGYEDLALSDWREEARECWQYVFISQNRDMEPFSRVHSMRRLA